MNRLRLRTRIMSIFIVGALLGCAFMAALSFELTRRVQVGARERTAVRAAYLDARTVAARLAVPAPDIDEVLRSLDTGANRRVLLLRSGRWYARNADTGLTAAIPPSLTDLVSTGAAATQRVRVGGAPAVIVGVPLPGGDHIYAVDSMRELDSTLHTLSWILLSVAATTTLAFGLWGAHAARRVARPLATVAAAARDISGGRLDARLDPGTEPDVRELAAAFNDMVDQLQARLARDRRFAADVSHELRSPLQTLTAAVGVLERRRGGLDDRAARAVDLVAEELRRFQRLVTDLLDLASSEAAGHVEPVDVHALAVDACARMGVPAGIVTDRLGADRLWPVDRRRFERVLDNLLDNAAKYGGGATELLLLSAGAGRLVQVDDEGPGVAEADREQIFERFFRGAAAASRGSGSGTGLGLALVDAYVRAHQGRVALDQRPGGGARFTVHLPGPA